MMWMLAVLFGAAALWTMAYREAGAVVWVSTLATAVAVLTLLAGLPWYIDLPVLLLAAGAAAVFGVPALRHRFITTPLLRQFRRVMPVMSPTEREALEAGTVWWDAELFSGRPDWQRLMNHPEAALSDAEHAFLDGPVEGLCRMLDDWRITHEEQDLPPEVWDHIRRYRYFGLSLPVEYGGLGFSARAHSEVVMKLGSRSITAAVTVMVPNSLGPGQLLLRYGTAEQKAYYLPRLARGEEIPCFALTGPEAGSDAAAIPDRGVVCHGQWRGERVLGVRLNWEKRYITLGPVATLIGLAFRLFDPDHLLGEREDLGTTLALVPRATPGVEIGERHIPMGLPFQNGPNRGRDVFVPLEQLIGGREYIGQGWRMLMECLSEGRGVSLPALSVGAGKMACRYTGAYAAIRRQFNLPIGRFEGVQEALARIAGLTYQMDAARVLTLAAIDAGERPAVLSAVLKYHLTERYRRVINDAMDVQGGSGVCLGPRNLIARAYQAIPIAVTVEGANILTRSMIIFGQGAIRCHPWVLKEFAAAQEPDRRKALIDFDAALVGHAGFLIGNMIRSLSLGLTRGRLSKAPVRGPTRHYFQRLNWMSAAFALCADVAMMTLGGALKRKERLSARLGDVLSEMYLTSAVLRRFEDDGRPDADLALVHWACEDALYRMQESLRLLLRNLPFRPLAWALRLIVFPTGAPWTEPDDRRGRDAARVLLSPSATRDRLTSGIFTPDDPQYREGLIEQAFAQTARVAPLEETLKAAHRAGVIGPRDLLAQAREACAQGLIDRADLEAVERMGDLRREVITVDAFEAWGRRNLLGASVSEAEALPTLKAL
jgi:acyl-CoA dehydrogenase